MSRVVLVALAALALLAPAAEAKTSLQRSLSRSLSGAGSGSGAYVMDSGTGKVLYSARATTPRILASNTKLFTSAAVLGRLGPDAMLATTVVGTGTLRTNGAWDGNLFLRGGGDPTFGDSHFNRGYGSSANVETVARSLDKAGIKSVTGHVYGDETLFDTRRGVPDSGWRTSPWIGPLSGLDFNHGYGQGGRFLPNPALYAAERLDSALAKRGIKVRARPGVRQTPSGAVELAEVRSPSVGSLIRMENKVSDNFFAEMLAKGLAVSGRSGGPVRQPTDPLPEPPVAGEKTSGTEAPTLPGPATTTAGARVVMRFAGTLGASPHLVDGSGLTRSDKASPRSVARLLDGMSKRDDFSFYFNSLPIAGRDGTLDNRMRSGPARGRCHAKTGTLTNVSALSGYCKTRGGRMVVFSILMNRVNVSSAHTLQDRMANAIARWRG